MTTHLEFVWGLDICLYSMFYSCKGVPRNVICRLQNSRVLALVKILSTCLTKVLDWGWKWKKKNITGQVDWDQLQKKTASHVWSEVRVQNNSCLAIWRSSRRYGKMERTDEKLLTVFFGKESLLNSLPLIWLIHQTSEVWKGDLLPLNRFLHGQIIRQLAKHPRESFLV